MKMRGVWLKTRRRTAAQLAYYIHFEELKIPTSELVSTAVPNIGFKFITEEVQRAVTFSRIVDGSVLLYPLHTTAAVIINEAEEGLMRTDIPRMLERLAPACTYTHDRAERILARPGEPENGPSHNRSVLVGSQAVELIVRDSRLLLGTWQAVIFLDLDPGHHAERRVAVQVKGLKK